MTLKFSRCIRVRSLHMCTKFRISLFNSLWRKPIWRGLKISPLDISSMFHQSFEEYKFLFLNQHVRTRLFLPADDWRQQLVRIHKIHNNHNNNCTNYINQVCQSLSMCFLIKVSCCFLFSFENCHTPLFDSGLANL